MLCFFTTFQLSYALNLSNYKYNLPHLFLIIETIISHFLSKLSLYLSLNTFSIIIVEIGSKIEGYNIGSCNSCFLSSISTELMKNSKEKDRIFSPPRGNIEDFSQNQSSTKPREFL